MKDSGKFNNILNECLDRMLQGESIEECLRRYPEVSQDLEPLLRTAQAARIASTIRPSAEFKARARYEFQSRLNELSARKEQRTPFFRWRWQWQSGWAIALIAIMVVVLSGGGTVAASGGSMPDETLYPVKLATEKVHLALTFSDIGKAELNARYADRRVEEIVYLAEKDDTKNVQVTAQRLNSNLATMNSLVSPEDPAGDMEGFQGPESFGMSERSSDSSPQAWTSTPMIAAAPTAIDPNGLPRAAAPPQTDVLGASPETVMAAASMNPEDHSSTPTGNQVFPGTGSMDVSPQPVFQWPAADGAVSYDLQVADNPAFDDPLESRTGLEDTAWTFTGFLNYGQTYYWRYRSIDEDKNAGDWIANAFTVIAAPVPAMIPQPGAKLAPAGTRSTGIDAVLPPSRTASENAGSTQFDTAKTTTAPGSGSGGKDGKDKSRVVELEKLKKTIIDKAEANKERLEKALKKASPQMRPALREALARALAEYEKAVRLIDRDIGR